MEVKENTSLHINKANPYRKMNRQKKKPKSYVNPSNLSQINELTESDMSDTFAAQKYLKKANIELKEIEQADFYYKLVAKLGERYLSIYDSNVEYEIGRQKYQNGGYYVYATVDEAIFSDIPFHKGGNYIAPRTIIKVIAWGNFVVYNNGKMAFDHLVPIEDLGMPLGYKSTRQAKRNAALHADDGTLHFREKKFHLNMLKVNSTPEFEKNKFENVFKIPKIEPSKISFTLPVLPSLAPLPKNIKPSKDYNLKTEIASDLKHMFDNIEKKATGEETSLQNVKEEYDKDIVEGAKNILKNLLDIEI